MLSLIDWSTKGQICVGLSILHCILLNNGRLFVDLCLAPHAVHVVSFSHAVCIPCPRCEVLWNAQEMSWSSSDFVDILVHARDEVHHEDKRAEGENVKIPSLIDAIRIHCNLVHDRVEAVFLAHAINIVDPLLTLVEQRNVLKIHVDEPKKSSHLPKVESRHITLFAVPSANQSTNPEEDASSFDDIEDEPTLLGVPTDEMPHESN